MKYNIRSYCEQINKYLEYTDQFSVLCNNIKDFIKKTNSDNDEICSTLFFCVNIDFPILVEYADEVAEVFLMEPIVGQHLFNLVIDLAVNAEENKHSLKIGPVITSFQISLPPLLVLTTYSGKFTLPSSGLFIIKGILVAYTKPTVYCKSAVFRCPLEDCAGHEGQRVHHYNLTPSRVCAVCGSSKEEVLRGRINGNEVTAMFVSHNSVQHDFERHQGVKVNLKDYLINDLALGVCYNVVVSCRSSYLVGWGIERTTSEQVWRFEHQLIPVGVPATILQIINVIQKVDPTSQWALSATLSANIATHLYPVNSFFHLKTGLLLSLASQCSDGMPTPILAVGPDCSSLLRAATHLGRRCVNVTSSTLMNGSPADSSNWTEASPLLLATGGVCYLGDWAKFGSGGTSAACKIIAALEKGQIELRAPTQQPLIAPPTAPLRSVLWTYWPGDKASPTAMAQLQTLIEVFGVPFIGDGNADVEAVADHLLCEAMQSGSKLSAVLIPTNDLKKYIEIASSIKVNLTSKAKHLIRNYFVASRRERPDCLPLTAIKTMTSLAEAHARLCLRSDVIYEDVVIVAYLYEAAITELYGPSVMTPPPPVIGVNSIDPEDPIVGLQTQVNTALVSFAKWLDVYIKSLISENSMVCSLTEE